jgi:hypothetical protein
MRYSEISDLQNSVSNRKEAWLYVSVVNKRGFLLSLIFINQAAQIYINSGGGGDRIILYLRL